MLAAIAGSGGVCHREERGPGIDVQVTVGHEAIVDVGVGVDVVAFGLRVVSRPELGQTHDARWLSRRTLKG
jgi:hypothetical protein